jgi:hypothetical protein
MKKMILAGALAIMTSVSLFADPVYVNFTGSSAYRSFTETAIKAAFTNLGATGFKYGYQGTKFGSGTYAIFTGTISSQQYVVRTSWSGSEAGIKMVSTQTAIPYFPYDTAVDALLTSGGTPSLEASVTLTTAIPNYALSDTAQAASAYTPAKGYTKLTDSGALGVNVFKWVASNNASSLTKVSNMTSQLAKTMFAQGFAPLALMTASTADQTSLVALLGRNPDSGTRVTAVLESGYSTTDAVVQFEPISTTTEFTSAVSATNSAIVALQPWPTDKVNGSIVSSGNSGYSSGGSLAKAMANANWSSSIGLYTDVTSSGLNDGTGMPVSDALYATYDNTTGNTLVGVAYLAASDADSYITAGTLVELAYNGYKLGAVTYASAADLVQGRYTFWSYEHMLSYSTTGFTSNALAKEVKTILTTNKGNVLTNVVLPANLAVQRNADGAFVYTNY